MTDFSSEPISADVRIEVVCLDRRDAVERRVGAFMHAAAKGWLGGMVTAVERRSIQHSLLWRLHCDRVPLEAIGVLHGMLQHLVEIEEAAQSYLVIQDAGHANLLQDHYASPDTVVPDFPVAHRESSGVAPPMSLVIAFQQPVPSEARHQLQMELQVWSELLKGGYPAEDDPLGSSGIAAVSVNFANPRMAVFATDGSHFGPAGFDPLIRLLTGLHRRFRIEHLSIE